MENAIKIISCCAIFYSVLDYTSWVPNIIQSVDSVLIPKEMGIPLCTCAVVLLDFLGVAWMDTGKTYKSFAISMKRFYLNQEFLKDVL